MAKLPNWVVKSSLENVLAHLDRLETLARAWNCRISFNGKIYGDLP